MSGLEWRQTMMDRLSDGVGRIGVIGLGYVGLPLACSFAQSGLDVTGIDVDADKVEEVNRGHSYIGDVASAEVQSLVNSRRLRATTDFGVIAHLDAVSICVPTPLLKSKDPNISHVVSAMDEIAKYAHPGLLVVLESTTYPGTTEEVIVPRLLELGLTPGVDVFVAFSPERVDPGNGDHGTHNTPKVIGGQTRACTDVAEALYQHCTSYVVKISSPAAAEMVKLLENTFRAVNIGLINEFAMMCDRLGLDVWEIIDAAATKPFGFMKFQPGPGLGGHCIPIDPLYLSWKLRQLDYEARFIALADSINTAMPRHVMQKVVRTLNAVAKPIRGAKILVVGLAYKPNVPDIRESPALQIIKLLADYGAQISVHDPHVAHAQVQSLALQSTELTAEIVADQDLVLIITDHRIVDWQIIAENAQIVVDTRNALGKYTPIGSVTRL